MPLLCRHLPGLPGVGSSTSSGHARLLHDLTVPMQDAKTRSEVLQALAGASRRRRATARRLARRLQHLPCAPDLQMAHAPASSDPFNGVQVRPA